MNRKWAAHHRLGSVDTFTNDLHSEYFDLFDGRIQFSSRKYPEGRERETIWFDEFFPMRSVAHNCVQLPTDKLIYYFSLFRFDLGRWQQSCLLCSCVQFSSDIPHQRSLHSFIQAQCTLCSRFVIIFIVQR